MKVLLLGSGGREHALAWKISQSDKLEKLWIAPGNAGTSDCGENVDISPANFEKIGDFAIEHKVDLVIVGPEAPLVDGIHDYFRNNEALKSIGFVGPQKEAAQLEGSKDFAKQFMQKYNIPTAAYETFSKSSLDKGLKYLEGIKAPYVLKADGLAAGKGVLILDELEEAKTELKEMLSDNKFGEASSKVVIEEFLSGIELSCFILTDGNSYVVLPEAKDYKRIGEGDTGLNTGGMGAVSPVPFADEEFLGKVERKVIKPTVDGLKSEGIEYNGFIFFGLIKVEDEPFVIEYNVRMGDPETEVVIPRVKSDLLELFDATAQKKLGEYSIEFVPETAATVMLVSGGYPGSYEKGKEMSGMSNIEDTILFHAGTKEENGRVLTNGGRVIALTSFGKDIQSALNKSYKNAKIVDFDKKYYRKDIGKDLM